MLCMQVMNLGMLFSSIVAELHCKEIIVTKQDTGFGKSMGK